MSTWRMSKIIRSKLVIDVGIATIVLLLMAPRLTGVVIHEWLAILFVIPLIVHLLLNWSWIVVAARKFLGYMPGEMRINTLVNAAFYVTMTGAIFSGVLVSEAFLPTLGIERPHDPVLRWLHSFSADAMLIVLGLHLGMNWTWVGRVLGALLPGIHPRSDRRSAPLTRRVEEGRSIVDAATYDNRAGERELGSAPIANAEGLQ